MDDAPKKCSESSNYSSGSSGRRRTRRSSPMPLEEMLGFEEATQMAMELSKQDEAKMLRDLERAERDAAAATVDAAVAAAASFNTVNGAKKNMVPVGDLANTNDSNKENQAPKVALNDPGKETQAPKDDHVSEQTKLRNPNIVRRSTRTRGPSQRLQAITAQATTVARSPSFDPTVEHEQTQELSPANVRGTKRKGSSKKPEGKKNNKATTIPTAAPLSNTATTKMSAPAKKPAPAKKATPAMDPDEKARQAFIAKEAKYAKAYEPYDRYRQGPPRGRTYVSRSGQLLLGPEDPPYHRLPGTVPSRAQATQKKEAKAVSSHRQVKYVPTDKPMPTAGIPSDRPSRPKPNMQRFADAISCIERDLADESDPSDETLITADESANDGTAMHRWLMDCTSDEPESEEVNQTVSASSAENTVDEDTLLAAHALLSLAAGHNLGPQEFTETRYIEAPGPTDQLWRHLLATTPSLTIGKLEFLSPLKRLKDMQEDAFHHRPSIKIVLPDMLKGLLVDDWEAVTKTNQLVPLPHPKPVTVVLDNYLEYEKAQRQEGSASIDILEETIAGLKEYFDKCLGRILLYRFERAQYAEVREKWITEGSDLYGKTASDTYGSEHLMRLFTSLPELVAQTNMDQQSVNRLREELTKFTQWLTRNAGDYFLNEYEAPSAEYSEKAKN
ncbi:hypothetical protein LQW54_009656 [Pestalotiopsis sp. IQ-011]